MATPADQRLLELVDKWLTSLDLHLQYCLLDDDSYSKIQPWPAHQRPSRWIIDLAKQKALALRSQIQQRVEAGDATFCESLELMAFLANLVGAEHIERFIPLAEPGSQRAVVRIPAGGQLDMPGDESDGVAGTREMPTLFDSLPREPVRVGSSAVARTGRGAAEAKARGDPEGRPDTPVYQQPVVAPAYSRDGPSEAARDQVIADAARLVQWGRKWYELAELISSMDNRPHLTDVRRILKDNKPLIDKKAGRS